MCVCTLRVMSPDGYTKCTAYQAVRYTSPPNIVCGRGAKQSPTAENEWEEKGKNHDLRDEESLRLVGWKIRNAIRRKPCCWKWLP